MPFVPYKCATVLIPSGPSGHHLFGVVTDACRAGNHLLLSFSTIYDGKFFDPACVVEPGEHPFIKARSWVVYRDARIEHASKLARKIESGYFRTNHDLCAALCEKMFAGIDLSDHTPRYILEYVDGL